MIGLGLGWIPLDPSRLHVPGWVVAVLGLPFMGAGLLILGVISDMRNLMALMLIAFLGFFNWAAFSDDPLCVTRRADHVRPRPRHVACDEVSGLKRPLIVAAVMMDIVVVALVARRLRRYFVDARGVDLKEE